jgi:hypothetical protein
MLVKELIEKLKMLDENFELVFYSYIESGRGGSWIEVMDVDIVEDVYKGDNVIKFSISGEEDEDGGYD